MGNKLSARLSADDLIEFSENIPKPGMPCTACALPERAVIDEAKRRAAPHKVGGLTVRRWLIERCGYTEETAPSVRQIGHHFHRGHHREQS